MKKKKVELMRRFDVWSDNFIKIDTEGEDYYFEIGTDITTDIGEAVSIMMKFRNRWDEKFWDIEIGNINYLNITPENSLYWLSGGDQEWKDLENYKKNWSECYIHYQKEFGLILIDIIKNSKTLKDIRDGFVAELGIERLYEFALKNSFI